MLRLFGNKSDHPLANLKSAKQLLDDLPKTDAAEVLQEVSEWIEALFDPSNGFRVDHQFAVLRMLDESAHPYLNKIIHSYFGLTPPTEFQENRQWAVMNSYSTFIDMGYLDVIVGLKNGEKGSSSLKASIALISARGIDAVFGRLESAAVRYVAFEPQLWVHLAEFYAYAEAEGCLDELITLYVGERQTTVRRMFASVLMWYTAGVESFRPLDLHIAKRLINHLSKSFVVNDECIAESLYSFDLKSPSAPIRVKEEGAMYPLSLRFLGSGAAPKQLDDILKTLSKDLVPDELNIGIAYSAEVVSEVTRHLSECCHSPLPVRRPTRRKIEMKVNALNGFFNLVDETHVDLNLNDPVSDNWEVEDISANGLRCVLPDTRGSNVKIGTLVGLQPEKALYWGVGVVRRLRRDAQNKLHVGVRILSNRVESVVLDEHDALSSDDNQRALLLDRPDTGDGETLMLMRQDTFSMNRSPTMKLGDQSFLLMPLSLVERGIDFDLVRFRKMAQDSSAEHGD